MDKKKQKLYGTLLKIGCIGFGGGSALIPVIHRNIVEDNALIAEEDFNKDVTVAVSTPGALPVEISVGAGLRVGGLVGFFLGPILMSLPGTVLSLTILIILGQISGALSRQFSLLSMGITTYIMSEIICYIYKTFADIVCPKRIRTDVVKNKVLPDIRLLLKRIAISLAFIIAFGGIALCLCDNGFSFSWKACLSSILSFGGGDAYMAVAERLFVYTGLLASHIFFSVIVPTVNATPGSILCKTLSCIGYCIGIGISGSILTGLTMALCAYAFSICMSCITYAIGSFFLESITTLKVWKYISMSLRVIISALQVNILMKLSKGFIDSGSTFGFGGMLSIGMIILLVFLNLLIPARFNIKKIYVVSASVVLCLILGNY